MNFDITIIGGGIIGASLAHSILISKPNLKVVLIEKEDNHSRHQTGHNSGVIHSGIYYKPGSLKSSNCSEGYFKLLEFSKKNGIDFKITGKIIAARNFEEDNNLELLYERGKQNSLKGIKRLTKKEIFNKEPNLKVYSAIEVPQTGIIDYTKVTEKLLELFKKNGGQVIYNKKVNKLVEKKVIFNSKKFINSEITIVAAGLQSDRLTKTKYKIIPFRGEYFQVKKPISNYVKNIVYPVPDLNYPFLGVHFTRGINNHVEIGPNALLSFAREKYKSKFSFEPKDFLDTVMYKGTIPFVFNNLNFAINEVKRSFSSKFFMKEINSYFPDININDVFYSRSGIRAQICRPDGSLVDDFIVEKNKNIINILNAPSPAATASLSIANHIINKYL